MPLPNDEKLIALSEEILKQFEAMFGSHPGFRPGHAKGILLTGTFTPSSAAASLTRAQSVASMLDIVSACPADGPSSTREDDGRNNHGERDENPRLADPQLHASALTRWIERGLDYGVPS